MARGRPGEGNWRAREEVGGGAKGRPRGDQGKATGIPFSGKSILSPWPPSCFLAFLWQFTSLPMAFSFPSFPLLIPFPLPWPLPAS